MSLDISLTLFDNSLLSEKKGFYLFPFLSYEIEMQHHIMRILFQEIPADFTSSSPDTSE
jgi:hypothetical protein